MTAERGAPLHMDEGDIRLALLASIIESSNDAIMSANLDGIFISWNAAAERMFGYSAEEMIGQSTLLIAPPEKMQEATNNQSKSRDGIKIESYETLRSRKDGSTIPIFLSLSPIYDSMGAIIGSSVIARDITAEKEASKNARNMAFIIESSNDAIIGVNFEGIFISLNPAAERMYGYSAKEMIGQSIFLIIPENPHEDVDILRKIRGGHKIEPYETLQIRKDGSTISISLTLSPIHDESGTVIGASGIARDITAEKEASQNARNMASIIESSNDSITSMNLEGIFISWNAAAERMSGYLTEEIIGQHVSLIIPPEKMQESAENLSNILGGHKIEPYETLMTRKDGSSIPIFLTLSPIYDGNGAVIGQSGIARDITAEKEAFQNARNMASIIESSNDSITSANINGIITSWNHAAERMYGYSAKEIIGQSRSRLIPPENSHELVDVWSNIRDGIKIEPYEALRIRKDGSTISVSMTLSPIYDGNGVVTGLSSISRDITAEKEASQNARNMASIIESSNDSITSMNLEGIFISWNAAAERMSGYLTEEIIGQHVSLIIPPEKMQESAENLSNILGGHKIEPYETLMTRKDGSSIPIFLTLSPIYDGNGAVIGQSGISRDITAEKEASQNARNMASIIESSNDSITSANINGIITSWNPAAESMYGYSAKEMIGQSRSRLIPPENAHEDTDNLNKIWDGKKIEPYETLRIRKDGSTFPISLTISPIYDSNGVIIGASRIARDITAEKEASQNARNLALIIESSNDAIMSASFESIITSWNPAAERMYGYLAKEIIGQSFWCLILSENRDGLGEIMQKIGNGLKVEPYDTVQIRKDGSTFPLLMTISPVRDGNGVVIGASAIARDITREKQAAQYARNMASIIESSNDAITSGTIEGIITSWNPAAERMYGYLAKEMIGQAISCLIAPENAHEDVDIQSKIKDGYKIEPYETLRIRKDGSTIPISLTASPIYDSNGVVIGASATARDITAEKEMFRQLEEMNELRNEFVATVAHDLRGPMTSISGFAHLLIDEWSAIDDEKKIEYLRIITRNTDTLAEFVQDVLQVARIEAGEFTYNIASFDMRVLAQRALDEAIGPNKDQRFKLVAPDDLPLVLGDKERQWQVLINLLSNALKFSPEQEPITVELATIEGFVRVGVIDRGRGIAKEDLEKLFRKSERLLKSGNPTVPGNGLGLFIAKTLVEAQGGRIWCESAQGAGSTFFFTIPVAR